MALIRDPETLLYTPADRTEIYCSSVSVEDVISVLRRYKEGAPYSVITSEAAVRFEVTKTRIQELLMEARDLGLAYKEPGKFGKWSAMDKKL